MTRQPSGIDGFSTLEAAIALAILALMLGAAHQAISLATKSLRTAERHLRLTQQAQSLLAESERLLTRPSDPAVPLEEDAKIFRSKILNRGERPPVIAIVIGPPSETANTFLTFLPLSEE